MKKAALPGRAWRLLRLALLWPRRGGAFKRGLFVDLRLARGYLKGAAGLKLRRADRLRFGEREFSIEDTPVFRFKTPSTRLRSLRIPCITPAAADFCDDDDDDDFIFGKRERCGYLLDEEETGPDDIAAPDCQESEAIEEEEDDGIDMKAEEFIANFYEQMKMQRQMSWIQYNEMLLRGVSN